jgi:hypothetical protein
MLGNFKLAGIDCNREFGLIRRISDGGAGVGNLFSPLSHMRLISFKGLLGEVLS